MRRRNYNSRICIKNDAVKWVSKPGAHYYITNKILPTSSRTQTKVPYLSSLFMTLFFFIFFISSSLCGIFFSFRYRHATRHRWFVTTESYLVVAWGSVWCFAKCKGSLALFSFAACDDKTTEKAKEEERK